VTAHHADRSEESGPGGPQARGALNPRQGTLTGPAPGEHLTVGDSRGGRSGAVSGDKVGFLIGPQRGIRLREGRLARRIDEYRWGRTEAAVRWHGGWAVPAARWVAVLRAAGPTVAGPCGCLSGPSWPPNAVAGVSWSVIAVMVGYLGGEGELRPGSAVPYVHPGSDHPRCRRRDGVVEAAPAAATFCARVTDRRPRRQVPTSVSTRRQQDRRHALR